MPPGLLIGSVLLILALLMVMLRWLILTGRLSSGASRRKKLVEGVLDRMARGNGPRAQPKAREKEGFGGGKGV